MEAKTLLQGGSKRDEIASAYQWHLCTQRCGKWLHTMRRNWRAAQRLGLKMAQDINAGSAVAPDSSHEYKRKQGDSKSNMGVSENTTYSRLRSVACWFLLSHSNDTENGSGSDGYACVNGCDLCNAWRRRETRNSAYEWFGYNQKEQRKQGKAEYGHSLKKGAITEIQLSAHYFHLYSPRSWTCDHIVHGDSVLR